MLNSETYTPIDLLGKLSKEEEGWKNAYEVETIEEIIDLHPNIPASLIALLGERGITFEC